MAGVDWRKALILEEELHLIETMSMEHFAGLSPHPTGFGPPPLEISDSKIGTRGRLAGCSMLLGAQVGGYPPATAGAAVRELSG